MELVSALVLDNLSLAFSFSWKSVCLQWFFSVHSNEPAGTFFWGVHFSSSTFFPGVHFSSCRTWINFSWEMGLSWMFLSGIEHWQTSTIFRCQFICLFQEAISDGITSQLQLIGTLDGLLNQEHLFAKTFYIFFLTSYTEKYIEEKH